MIIKAIRIQKQIVAVGILLIFVLAVGRGQISDAFTAKDEKRTLILDAGHGGFDGGGVGASGTQEQYINLSIAKKTRLLAHFFGIPTVMTRENDEALDYSAEKSIRENKIADIKKRESIINSVENGMLISIHLNKFEDAKYKGAQVFYSKNSDEGESFAAAMQAYLVNGLDKNNTRKEKAAYDTIYLMKKTACPAIIIEAGFLSNPEEEALLNTDDYQKRIAASIFAGYANYINRSVL